MPTVTLTFSAFSEKKKSDQWYVTGNDGYMSWVSQGGTYFGTVIKTSNPQNLYASDNVYCNLAIVDYSAPVTADAIQIIPAGKTAWVIVKGQSGANSIPNDATITGIKVFVERYVDGSVLGNDELPNLVRDDTVYLTKDGANETGVEWYTDTSTVATYWSNTPDEVLTYGGPLYMWGTTWTPSDIKSANFGVMFSALVEKHPGVAVDSTIFIDQIKVEVTYTGGTTETNINPYGIRSTEFVSSLHRIVRNIKEYSVTTLEKLGVTRLTKGTAQIRPYGQISAQNLGQARFARSTRSFSIKSNEVLGRNSLLQNIKPYSVRSLESLSQNKFVSSYKPFGIVSTEKIGQSRLIQNINPFGTKSNEVLGNQSLKQNISPFSIKSIEKLGFDKIVANINPYPIRSVENLGRNLLLSSANINSFSIKTNELLSYNTRLSSGAVINHISIKTEKLGQNTLFPTNQIRHIGVASNQTIGITRLSTSYNITPKSITSLERI